ncbi:MAG: hypothetical protein CMJ65_12420 [Planctomycetaceae bacterium]|nr:hypothetical protein [Planctomycetaceae bacterium]
MWRQLLDPTDRTRLGELAWVVLAVVLWLGLGPAATAWASCGDYLHRSHAKINTPGTPDGRSASDPTQTSIPAPAAPCSHGRCRQSPSPSPAPRIPPTGPSADDVLTADPACEIPDNRSPAGIERGTHDRAVAGHSNRIDRPPRG